MAAYPPCGKGASPLGAGRAPSFFLQLRSTEDQSFRYGMLSVARLGLAIIAVHGVALNQWSAADFVFV